MPPCLHPLFAWRDFDNPEKKYTFQSRGIPVTSPLCVKIRCGKCIACKLEYARVWADRCYHESLLHKDNCFLTLTYSDSNLPSDLSVSKRDLQLFLKRLRKALEPLKIRYFGVGEYGADNLRPHYHVIIFGYMPGDLIPVGLSQSGIQQFASPFIDRIWNLGISTVTQLSSHYCRYIAHYSLKKLKDSERLPFNLEPEFRLMSRRPGIGRGYVEKFTSDIYNYDRLTYENGSHSSVPRYYDSVLEKLDPVLFEKIRQQRFSKSREKDPAVFLEELCDYRRTSVKEEYLNEVLKNKRPRSL